MRKIPIKPSQSIYNDEQWQAIHTVGSNILVSASAGSGKTKVLIERILYHIQDSYASIDELLVVTFTELAANEMKSRMESSLKTAISDTLDGELKRYLLDQLNKLPNAHIRTLHSFCLQVIQQFFYLIDFNPNFQLLTDETQKELLYEEAWTDVVNRIWTEESAELSATISSEDLLNLLARFSNSRSDSGLFNVVKELYLFASSHTEPKRWLSDMVEVNSNLATFAETELFQKTIKAQINIAAMSSYALLDQAESILLTLSQKSIDDYEATIREEKEQLRLILEMTNENSIKKLYQTMAGVSFGRWKSNSKKNEDYEAINEIKQLRDKAKDQVSKQIMTIFPYNFEQSLAVEEQVHGIIYQLSQLTQMFQDCLEIKKSESNVIDYNDLEHLTLDILMPFNQESKKREASVAAKYYQKLFKEILVDEYQDINDIQAAILTSLSREDTNQTSNLFMVGDVKQSIYGFRMAEPRLFLNKYHAYQTEDENELIILGKNYRSRAEILEFSNFIFERLMTEDFGEMNYGYNEALKVGNTSFLPNPPDEAFNIELLLNVKDGDQDEEGFVDEEIESFAEEEIFDKSIEAEAHILAQNIQEKIANRFLVFDKENTNVKQRPLEYSDIVILTSTKFPFLTVQQVFESYGIPLYAQKVESFFQRQEIRLMIALLKIIDNPVQDLPLVAILRSFFVNLSDEELSQIRISHPYGAYYQAVVHYVENFSSIKNPTNIERDIYSKLILFLKQLNHWQHLSQTVSLVELIWTIYQETNYLDYVAGLTNGSQRQINLHAFYERAAQFQKTSYKGVFGFVNYIEKVIQRENDLAEPVLLDGNQNFVRIMTVHASKGLEFPLVYLLNMGKKFNLTDVNHKRYIASKNYGLGIDLHDYQTMTKYQSLVKQALKIEKSNQLKAEEMRKLYVALTRCEQKLIMIGTVTSQEKVEQLQDEVRDITAPNQLTIATHERQKAQSWLEWILQAIAIEQSEQSISNFDLNQIDFQYINQNQIQLAMPSEQLQNDFEMEQKWRQHFISQLKNKEVINDSEVVHHIRQMMEAEYPYQLAAHTSSYQSVSELKRLYEEPRIEKLSHFTDRSMNSKPHIAAGIEEVDEVEQIEQIHGIRYTSDTFETPLFMQEESVSYADIGTYMHFILQQIDFSRFQNDTNYSEILTQQVNELVAAQLISQKHVEHLLMDKIIWFLHSDLGQLMIENPQRLNREKAFSMLIAAKTIFSQQLDDLEIKELANDQLLIHGVIDSYLKTEDGSLLLIDYKTDRFRPLDKLSKDEQIESVKARYRFQLSLYREALISATESPVNRTGLVLLDFEKVVWLDADELIVFS